MFFHRKFKIVNAAGTGNYYLSLTAALGVARLAGPAGMVPQKTTLATGGAPSRPTGTN